MSFFLYNKDPNRPESDKDNARPAIKVDFVTETAKDDAAASGPTSRVNLKAVVILGVVAVLALIVIVPLAVIQRERLRTRALEQARKAADDGHIDQALIALDHHLQNWPDDIPALELVARLRTEGARSLEEMMAAAEAQDLLLRVDPMGPDRQENRRHLVELYVRWTDRLRAGSSKLNIRLDKTEGRSRAAVKIAEQMIAFGSDDARTHRLLAMALESLAGAGDAAAMSQAIVEYEKVLRRDPGDVVAAERLATITHERNSDSSGADEILAELLEANPKSVEARMARYRFFSKTNRFERARDELEQAIKLAPTNPEVLYAATIEAIQRRDPAAARRSLDAIPNSKENRAAGMLRGLIGLAEQDPDSAVDVWRKGLQESAGMDRDLSWRLAYTLILLGRCEEADPLVAQYQRLAGEADPMLHFLKGLRAEATGRPSTAIAELEKLRGSIDRSWLPELSTTLGRAYEKINDDNRATIEYRQAIKGSPRLIGAWRSLARITRKVDPERAAQELEAALVQMPGDPALLLDLAAIRLEQQTARPPAERDWSKVNQAIDRASRAKHPDPNLVRVKAEVLFSTGRFDEALGLLEGTLKGPDRTRAEIWLSWANGLASRGRLDEALKALERAAEPDNAGDHASIRIARATLLVQAGRGRAAREELTRGVEALPPADRIALARALVQTRQSLGDKAGAREACLEWARMAPLDSQPVLTLLGLSQKNHDDEAARLGLEMLPKVGGEDEPLALAARALDLLQSNRPMPETRTARLEKAAELCHKLMILAPKLPVSRLVQGMVMERNHRIEDAIVEYQLALAGDTAAMALERLTQLYSRLKRFDDLAALQKKISTSVALDQVAVRMAIDQGDKVEAEKLVAQLTEGKPDDPEVLAAQARLFRELGKPEAAEASLRAMVEKAKDRPGPWVALVAFLTSQKAPDKAAEVIEKAKAEYQGERPELLAARLRWIVGDRETATRLYDEALAKYPEDLTTYQAACGLAEVTGRIDRAEALGRKALKIPSCSAWAARMLALLLSKRPDMASWKEAWSLVAPGGPGSSEAPGDRLLRASLLMTCPDRARRAEAPAALTELIEDLPASNPLANRARVHLTNALLEAGKLAEASKPIAEATEATVPADTATLSLAIEVLARADRPEEANRRLIRLAAIEPDSARTACGRAWVLLAQGKPEKAVEAIEEAATAAEKAPDAEVRHALYFNMLQAIRQPEAAERLARRIAGLWPRDACILAGFLGSKGRLDEALDACRVAAEAGSARDALGLAIGLVATGKLDGPQAEKARAIADAALAANPKDPGLALMAFALARRQNRNDDAMKICRQAALANPTNLLCLNALNDMAWIFSEDLDRPAEALVEVDRVLKAMTTTSAMDTRGVVLTRLGRYDEAIDQLERCLQKEPLGHRYLHLARAYQKAGKLQQYQDTVDRAKKAGINLAALGPKEREEFAAVIGR